MEDIEFINDAGFDRWKDIVQLIEKSERWALSENDFHWWKTGFGPSNLNLLVAVDKRTNQTVGCVVSAYYEPTDGSEPLMTIGAFFVHPSYRGTGIGLALFNKVIDDPRFKDINWGLDGASSMTKKYASKYGYDKYMDWKTSYFKISVEDVEPSRLDKSKEITIVGVNDVEIGKILEYDFNIQGKRVRRDKVLKSLLRGSDCFSRVALNKDGEVVGYGNIRKGLGRQLSTCPIYAETPEIASTLLREILESIPNLKSDYTYLWLLPADTNKAATELIQKLSGGKAVDCGVSYGQFTKSVIQTDGSKIFSATVYAMSLA
ncbi:hypothetical protein FO519_001740 [Halicephalobus sp. NKZ332]|nr:hypothetical protein FO519_001740 [Halicephalobus sp. NKZ332]